jgi:hypothetical protein
MKLQLIKNGHVIAYIAVQHLSGSVIIELTKRGYILGFCPLVLFELSAWVGAYE